MKFLKKLLSFSFLISLQFLELFCFSGHPKHLPGWYNSGVKEILARNPSVCLKKTRMRKNILHMFRAIVRFLLSTPSLSKLHQLEPTYTQFLRSYLDHTHNTFALGLEGPKLHCLSSYQAQAFQVGLQNPILFQSLAIIKILGIINVLLTYCTCVYSY